MCPRELGTRDGRERGNNMYSLGGHFSGDVSAAAIGEGIDAFGKGLHMRVS
jgi:hypothetical protein